MISSSSIIMSVNQVVNNNSTSSDKIYNMIIAVSLYNTMYKILTNNSSTYDTLTSLGESYYNNVVSDINNIKNEYISYNKCYTYISQLNINSFIKMSELEIKIAYQILTERIKSVDLSFNIFSEKMYNVYNIDTRQYKYLKNVHYKTLKPIYDYYNKMYGITLSDFNIISADTVAHNVGKIVIFNIANIKPAQIVYDLVLNNINIKYVKVNIVNDNIELITSVN